MQKLSRVNYLKAVLLLAVVVGNIFVWYAVGRENRDGYMTVAFLDVGQGDAIFIESPTGNQVIIDGGKDGAVLRRLGKMMPFYDRTIDLIMGTHHDLDHIGGLPLVVERYRVGAVMRPLSIKDTAISKRFEEDADTRAGMSLFAMRGQGFDLGGGASLLVLYPGETLDEKDDNENSIVAMLSYGEHKFLFTGDASQNIERKLMHMDGELLRADVLKVGHHGSKTSTDPQFVASVRPSYSVISSGCKNKFGHPHKEVIEALETVKQNILGTCESGNIVFRTNGTDLTLLTNKKGNSL
ncbi:MAG: MBL fold metallo-hydrolase [Candidatus Vogelbacteria bacterium CG10_big_fil_rev_8_21_14_0_10_45_14]|uniref:MBL fold metallo-hydrolase n=1 Tax=Candidatus Vogelbacteria bacterium CG10_big_fil_rev_8_21_14_0_10_45_14 TaxID=1975042 RepID=A0A2H0RM95_9BACT|nr:MAG: MBL fold metallo-hydrolase [Candidatus Vogelbacteria bacterium CG10_big_fil_rev_8_21_14_0_10_45_14]